MAHLSKPRYAWWDTATWNTRFWSGLFLLSLYLAGVAHWVYVFAYAEFRARDWRLIGRYLSVLRDSLAHAKIPYFMTYHDHYTGRFLGLPETPLTPQVLLVPFLGDYAFNLVNISLLFTCGFVGLLLIRKALGLSWLPFTFLFLLFNFNGYLVSRVAIGHAMWYGYFFLPFFLLLLLRMIEEPGERRTWILMAFVLFVMELQGSFHLFVYCAIYLLLIGLTGRGHFKPVVYVLAAASLMCMFRFLPAAVTWWGHPLAFWTGYPSLSALLDGLTVINDAKHTYTRFEIGWWELDCYIGAVGLAILVYFGIGLRITGKPETAYRTYRELDLPNAAMVVLAFGPVFSIVSALPIPLIASQSLSTRFIIMPVLMLSVLAAIHMQRFLESGNARFGVRVLLALCAMALAWNLYQHSTTWRLHDVELSFGRDYFTPITAAQVQAPDLSDPSVRWYIYSVWASAVVSLLAVIYFASKLRQLRRANQNTPECPSSVSGS